MRNRARALYAISVAAELSGTAIQNLRVYERRGLVSPGRTEGGTRRYSEEDVERLVRIRELLDAGLNLAGIDRVLELLDAGLNLAGIDRVLELEDEVARLRGRR